MAAAAAQEIPEFSSFFLSLLFGAKLFSFSCKHFVLLGFTDSTKLSTVNIPEVY